MLNVNCVEYDNFLHPSDILFIIKQIKVSFLKESTLCHLFYTKYGQSNMVVTTETLLSQPKQTLFWKNKICHVIRKDVKFLFS